MKENQTTIEISTTGGPVTFTLRRIARRTKLGWPMFRSLDDGCKKLWYRNPATGKIYRYGA